MLILKFINKEQIMEMSFDESDIHSIPSYFEKNKTPFIVIASTGMINPEDNSLFSAKKWKYWRKETFLHKDWIED